MEPRAQTIRRMFSAISPHYDLLNHLLSGNIDRLWRRKVAAQLIDGQTRRVLDVCAGTGDLSFAFLKRFHRQFADQGQVTALDFSREMLMRGQAKLRKSGQQKRMLCCEGDGLHLPFADGTFDAVAVAFGLRNLTDWEGGLREMARVTRPGGRVAILEFSLPRNRFLRALYLFYFTKLLPRIGNLVSRSSAYQYLMDTVLRWPAPEELKRMMECAGLGQVQCQALSGGIAYWHVGVRQACGLENQCGTRNAECGVE